MSHGGSIRGDGGVHGPHQVVSQSLITDFSGRREGDTEEHFHLDSFSVVLVSKGGFRSTSMWVEWNLREPPTTQGDSTWHLEERRPPSRVLWDIWEPRRHWDTPETQPATDPSETDWPFKEPESPQTATHTEPH